MDEYLCKWYVGLSVTKQKGKSQNELQGNKARLIFRKRKISYPVIRTFTCAYQKVRNFCFSEDYACFVTPVLMFALLSY